MNIPLVIPSYQRPHVLLSNTLAFLNRIKYNQSDIFVVVGGTEGEYNEYLDVITSIYPNINVLIGDNSNAKASQLNFIKSELLEEGQTAIIMDDDIKSIVVKYKDELNEITESQFITFIELSIGLMSENNVGLCGVNSNDNAFYMRDYIRLCKSCICGGFQLFINHRELNLDINQGSDAYESCWYLDKYNFNIKWDFIGITTKLFNAGGLYDYRKDKALTHADYLKVAETYPQYLDYYTWNLNESMGISNLGKEVKIPVSRRKELTIELKWKRQPSKKVRHIDDWIDNIV